MPCRVLSLPAAAGANEHEVGSVSQCLRERRKIRRLTRIDAQRNGDYAASALTQTLKTLRRADARCKRTEVLGGHIQNETFTANRTCIQHICQLLQLTAEQRAEYFGE